MYICKDDVCDPVCDFCWYCICDNSGIPVKCEKGDRGFEEGWDIATTLGASCMNQTHIRK